MYIFFSTKFNFFFRKNANVKNLLFRIKFDALHKLHEMSRKLYLWNIKSSSTFFFQLVFATLANMPILRHKGQIIRAMYKV